MLNFMNLQLFADEPDSTAGEPAGPPNTDNQSYQGGNEPQQIPQQGGKTFSQADVDRFVQDRLHRERKTWENKVKQYEDSLNYYEQMYQQQQRGQYGKEQAVSEWDNVQAQLEDIKLEREIDKLGKKYPDFQENENDILQVALNIGTENLEVAYRYWKMDKFNSAEYEQKIIQNYLGKAKERAKTPPVQGVGGGSPTGKPAPKNLDDAFKAAMNRMKNNTT